MEWEKVSILAANSVIEFLCCILIAESVIPYKYKKNSPIQYILMAVMVIVTVYMNRTGANRVFQMISYLCVAGTLMLRYTINLQETILYTMLCLLMISVFELIAFIPCQLLFRVADTLCSFLVVLLTLGVCYLIYRKQLIHKKVVQTYIQSISIPAVTLLFFVLLVNSIVGLYHGMSLEKGIYLVFLIMGMLFMMYRFGGYLGEIRLRKQYTRQYDQVIVDIRERQHKFANQLDAVYSMFTLYTDYDALVDKQKEALDYLRQYILPNKILILGNPLVIAHINNKISEAEEKQIKVQTEFDCDLTDLGIPDICLVEIIGNLLDNAMDACQEKDPTPEILLKIIKAEKEICISVSNSHEKIPYSQYSNFFKTGYSTKGKGRGLGLAYVKKLVNQYHGRIEAGNIETEQGTYFQINVYFKE